MGTKQHKHNIKENKFNSGAENISRAFWKNTQNTSYFFKYIQKHICIYLSHLIDENTTEQAVIQQLFCMLSQSLNIYFSQIIS